MHKEWADKWVAALRSGEYKQDKRQLRTDKGYCCLGVLCEVAGLKPTIKSHKEWYMEDHKVTDEEYALEKERHAGKIFSFPENIYLYENEAAIPPESIASLVGFRDRTGGWVFEGHKDDLNYPYSFPSANDHAGWDFNKIADFVEKNYEKL